MSIKPVNCALHLGMAKKLIFLFLSLLPFAVFSQNTFLTGNIFDNDTRSTSLPGVAVKNLTSKAIVLTDKDGHFAISAKKGDLISYTLLGYHTDTVYLTNLFPKNVYLRVAVNTLETVNIVNTKLSPYLDTKDPNAVAARRVDYSQERGGARLNLGFGKYRRNQEKIQGLEEELVIIEEINKNFNATVVQKMVNYKGNDLVDYLDWYRPTINQIKADRNFNYSYYIATTFNEWQKLPADQRKMSRLLKMKIN